MMNEPTLEQIWEVRRKIYARCDNNPQKLVAYLMERQKQNPQRLLQTIGDIKKWQGNSAKENLPADTKKDAAA